MKKFFFIGGVLTALLLASTSIAAVDMIWVSSYETIAFDTPDGDLGLNQYALKSGGGYYVRTVAVEQGNFVSTTSITALVDKTLVTVRCEQCVYYSEFINSKGRVVRVPYTKTDYDGLRYTPNYPKPAKTEIIVGFAVRKAFAAIAFDATSNSGAKSAVSSFSWSHTNTGSDLTLIIGVSMFDATAGDRVVNSITYNAVNLTKVRHDSNVNANGRVELWYLASPATGANTVSVTLAGVNDETQGGAISLTGTAASPLDANNGATGAVNDPSVNVTTVADNSWVIDALGNPTAVTCINENPGAGQTERVNVDSNNLGLDMSHEGPKTPAGSVTMSWAVDIDCGGTEWEISAASFAPAVAGGEAAPPQPIQPPEIIMFE